MPKQNYTFYPVRNTPYAGDAVKTKQWPRLFKYPSEISNGMYCFSPPVMLATLVIEVALAIYTLFRYRRGIFAKVAAVILVLLAVFQLAEYQVCRNLDGQFWARLGFVAITILPILGIYLVSLISRQKHLLKLGFVAATLFALTFMLAPTSIVTAYCGGNYVIFNGPAVLFRFYAVYYFGFLMLALWESVEAMTASRQTSIRRLLRWVIVGYLSFMLPMGLAYAFYLPARQAVASIMCGFAIVFAIILALKIVPNYYDDTSHRRH